MRNCFEDAALEILSQILERKHLFCTEAWNEQEDTCLFEVREDRDCDYIATETEDEMDLVSFYVGSIRSAYWCLIFLFSN